MIRMLTIFSIVALLYVPSLAHAELIIGSGTLSGLGGWDFNSMQTVDVDGSESDFGVAHVYELDDYYVVALNGASVTYLPDSTYEELRYAPSDTLLYTMMQIARFTGVYVMRTRLGKYVKFAFSNSGYSNFDYTLQSDGSRKLYEPIAVEYHSWGIIKLKKCKQ